jgi:hypothetical protein
MLYCALLSILPDLCDESPIPAEIFFPRQEKKDVSSGGNASAETIKTPCVLCSRTRGFVFPKIMVEEFV